eukprot:352616-Chlamydomonas_euryale.AAC.10
MPGATARPTASRPTRGGAILGGACRWRVLRPTTALCRRRVGADGRSFRAAVGTHRSHGHQLHGGPEGLVFAPGAVHALSRDAPTSRRRDVRSAAVRRAALAPTARLPATGDGRRHGRRRGRATCVLKQAYALSHDAATVRWTLMCSGSVSCGSTQSYRALASLVALLGFKSNVN